MELLACIAVALVAVSACALILVTVCSRANELDDDEEIVIGDVPDQSDVHRGEMVDVKEFMRRFS